VVSRWLVFFLIRWCVAGSDEGQLAMVAPAAAIATAGIVPKARGEALGSGGEVPALAVVRDEAGAATRRLKGVTKALSQVTEALSQVR
jgi:predicted phage tail protein